MCVGCFLWRCVCTVTCVCGDKARSSVCLPSPGSRLRRTCAVAAAGRNTGTLRAECRCCARNAGRSRSGTCMWSSGESSKIGMSLPTYDSWPGRRSSTQAGDWHHSLEVEALGSRPHLMRFCSVAFTILVGAAFCRAHAWHLPLARHGFCVTEVHADLKLGCGSGPRFYLQTHCPSPPAS